MKKFMVLAALVAMVVAALAIPAMAAQRQLDKVDENSVFSGSDHRDRLGEQNSFLDFVDRFGEQRFSGQDRENSFDDHNDWWNGNNWWHGNNWWNDNQGDNLNDAPAVSQRSEQEVESGDSSQTFNVTSGGDNSNSCQGIQGISNTGNAVNSTNVLQYASEGGVGVSDSGNFTISPSQSTTCKQSVNQSATAAG